MTLQQALKIYFVYLRNNQDLQSVVVRDDVFKQTSFTLVQRNQFKDAKDNSSETELVGLKPINKSLPEINSWYLKDAINLIYDSPEKEFAQKLFANNKPVTDKDIQLFKAGVCYLYSKDCIVKSMYVDAIHYCFIAIRFEPKLAKLKSELREVTKHDNKYRYYFIKYTKFRSEEEHAERIIALFKMFPDEKVAIFSALNCDPYLTIERIAKIRLEILRKLMEVQRGDDPAALDFIKIIKSHGVDFTLAIAQLSFIPEEVTRFLFNTLKSNDYNPKCNLASAIQKCMPLLFEKIMDRWIAYLVQELAIAKQKYDLKSGEKVVLGSDKDIKGKALQTILDAFKDARDARDKDSNKVWDFKNLIHKVEELLANKKVVAATGSSKTAEALKYVIAKLALLGYTKASPKGLFVNNNTVVVVDVKAEPAASDSKSSAAPPAAGAGNGVSRAAIASASMAAKIADPKIPKSPVASAGSESSKQNKILDSLLERFTSVIKAYQDLLTKIKATKFHNNLLINLNNLDAILEQLKLGIPITPHSAIQFYEAGLKLADFELFLLNYSQLHPEKKCVSDIRRYMGNQMSIWLEQVISNDPGAVIKVFKRLYEKTMGESLYDFYKGLVGIYCHIEFKTGIAEIFLAGGTNDIRKAIQMVQDKLRLVDFLVFHAKYHPHVITPDQLKILKANKEKLLTEYIQHILNPQNGGEVAIRRKLEMAVGLMQIHKRRKELLLSTNQVTSLTAKIKEWESQGIVLVSEAKAAPTKIGVAVAANAVVGVMTAPLAGVAAVGPAEPAKSKIQQNTPR